MIDRNDTDSLTTPPSDGSPAATAHAGNDAVPGEAPDFVHLMIHPECKLYPEMSEGELEALTESIRTDGLQNPIVLHRDGSILDGRNRELACRRASVAPQYITYEGNDPRGFVFRQNLLHRNQNESQRAMVLAKMETTTHGGDRRNRNQDVSLHLDRVALARLGSVSPSSIAFASTVLKKAVPEIVARVERGEIAVSLAAKIANLPRSKQKELSAAPEAILRAAASGYRPSKRVAKLPANAAKAPQRIVEKRDGVTDVATPQRSDSAPADAREHDPAVINNRCPATATEEPRAIAPDAVPRVDRDEHRAPPDSIDIVPAVHGNIDHSHDRPEAPGPRRGNEWLRLPRDAASRKRFMRDLGQKLRSGRVAEAIVAIDANVASSTLQEAGPPDAICFIADGEHNDEAERASTLLYFGDNPEKFIDAHAAIGTRYRRAGGLP